MLLFLSTKICLAADESLDAAFLEWLGQVTEVEELGMNIDELLQQDDDLPNKDENNQGTGQ